MGRGVVAAALPPREVGPHQVNRGRGQALPSRRPWGPYAGVRGRPASSRCTRGEGGGGGEAGRRKPTTKLASPSARLDLNGRSPRSRSAAETLESALGRLGAACGRSRYRARAAGWAEGSGLNLGSGFGLLAWCGQPGSCPGWGRRISPLSWSTAPRARRGALPRGYNHKAIRTRQGPFLFSGQRLVPAPGPLPLRTSGKNLRADGRGEVEGRWRATENVGGRWNWGGAWTPVPRSRAQSKSMSFHVTHPS